MKNEDAKLVALLEDADPFTTNGTTKLHYGAGAQKPLTVSGLRAARGDAHFAKLSLRAALAAFVEDERAAGWLYDLGL